MRPDPEHTAPPPPPASFPACALLSRGRGLAKASCGLTSKGHHTPRSPLAPFAVGGATGGGAVVRGREVEVAGGPAEVQDGAAGSREGVQRGGEGRAELLRVVPCVVLCDDLLRGQGRKGGAGSGRSQPRGQDLPGAEPRSGPAAPWGRCRARAHAWASAGGGAATVCGTEMWGPPGPTTGIQVTHQTEGLCVAAPRPPPWSLAPPQGQRRGEGEVVTLIC